MFVAAGYSYFMYGEEGVLSVGAVNKGDEDEENYYHHFRDKAEAAKVPQVTAFVGLAIVKNYLFISVEK